MGARSDNFTRADSTTSLGTPSDGGSDWVAQSGTWGIITNQGYNPSGGSSESAVLESSLSDVIVQATIGGTNAVAVGLVFRAADASNYWYAQFHTPTASWYLSRFVAASNTNVTSVSGSWTAGDIIKVVTSGSSITLYQNGTNILSTTDSTMSTNTKHGLYTNQSDPRFTVFTISDNSGIVVSQMIGAFTQANSSPGWTSTYV